ncbi:ATP-binding protein [Verrucomicrobia bacterium]|nr:ATP-binding protein [Verrucomicrobiota bacterium]
MTTIWSRAIAWSVVLLILVGAPLLARSQGAFNWRNFSTANGLTNSAISSVTIGPRGTLWLKDDEFSTFTRFDGYQFDSYPFPFPGFSPSRIFEGRSGQLWAVDQEAVLEYSNGRWVRFPLLQIRQEFRQQLRRLTQPISLIPLRINNLLILLTDQLIRFDSLRNDVTTIKRADGMKIGKFKELIELTSQSLLVTGEKGIARIEVSPREISEQTPWIEFVPEGPVELRDFQRPTENADGSVSMVTIGSDQHRYIATIDGDRWSFKDVNKLKLRFAWKQSSSGFWGQSYNAIYHIDETGASPVGQDEVSAGLLLDVAIESPEIFHIASSEGLYRHARSCWQRPEEIRDIDSSIHGALEDRQDRLWFLNSDALLMYQARQWTRYPWPEETEMLFRPSDSINQLNDETLLISNGNTHYTFHIASSALNPFFLEGNTHLKRIAGTTHDGTLIAHWNEGDEGEEITYLGLLNGHTATPFSFYDLPWTQSTELDFVIESKNQEFWFGDQEGIGLINVDGITRFGVDQGLPNERASCLVELDDGLIWASLGNGVYEFDGKRWKAIFSAPSRINALIQASDQSVWAASNTGIHRFHYDSWVTITALDGLTGNAIYSIIEDQKGQIWAGTTRGVNHYQPSADLDPPRSNIQVLANAPDPTGSNSKYAVFEARDKWDFTPKERLLFSYRLDERPWTPYSEKNDLVLENLSAGQHRLEVRAMDRNWNEEEVAADYQFMWIIPWYDDPRLVIISAIGFGVILLLSGLAINRHIRLTRSYAEVERIVAIRTAELESANKELLQNQKMRALGNLSAGIAHDFNGILSIIKGSTQIIESNLDNPEKVKTRLQRISLVVDQGAGVIRAMLGLARSGEKHLRTVDMNETAQTTIQIMGDRLPKSLQVNFDRGHPLPPVRLVVDLLQQTLVNLISNASDAMEGIGTIDVKTGHIKSTPTNLALKPGPAESFNYVAIQDTGYGIPSEVLPRIFEPFFTSKSFSSKRGTGLGLSMVYEMARELKAGLAVESEAGKGSTFTIYIPVTSQKHSEKGSD